MSTIVEELIKRFPRKEHPRGHPIYHKGHWIYCVVYDRELRGYWEWVAAQIEKYGEVPER